MHGSLEIHPNAGIAPILMSFNKANVQATAKEEEMGATFCIPEILNSPELKNHSARNQAKTSGDILARHKSHLRQS